MRERFGQAAAQLVLLEAMWIGGFDGYTTYSLNNNIQQQVDPCTSPDSRNWPHSDLQRCIENELSQPVSDTWTSFKTKAGPIMIGGGVLILAGLTVGYWIADKRKR